MEQHRVRHVLYESLVIQRHLAESTRCEMPSQCAGYLAHPFNKNLLSGSETGIIRISAKALTSCLRVDVTSFAGGLQHLLSELHVIRK